MSICLRFKRKIIIFGSPASVELVKEDLPAKHYKFEGHDYIGCCPLNNGWVVHDPECEKCKIKESK